MPASRLANRACLIGELCYSFTISLGLEGVNVFAIEAIRYLNRRLKRAPVEVRNLHSVKSDHNLTTSSPRALPLVSIIIPTKDRLDLLRPCIESILDKTTYPNYEIVVIDNGSKDSETLSYLNQLQSAGSIVLRYPRPFNFSAICNFGVEASNGAIICLLNNDTEVISPEWLDVMVSHTDLPGRGITGALLTYPDGTIQHIGIALGYQGAAGHVFSGESLKSESLASLVEECFEVNAVTFACAMFSRDTFHKLHGLDESLKVGLNDVDFCLRAQEIGLTNIICTSAHLVHHESKSRKSMKSLSGSARATIEVLRFTNRHSKALKSDYFFFR